MQIAPLAFDFQSTTPCAPEVLRAMEPYWTMNWGNPSNRQNHIGINASAAIGFARDKLASSLNIESKNIIFTSGATESNNLALLGYARAKFLETGRTGHIITLQTEHHAVLDPLRQLQREGFRLTELKTDSEGLISIPIFSEAFQEDTILVSVMLANNEIGVIQPLDLIAEICNQRGVLLHSDAAQAFGHIPFEINELDIGLLSLSAHKFYGPKGIGALVVNHEIPLIPLQWGGGQENGIRPGTLPVPLVVGMAEAAKLAIENLDFNYDAQTLLRNQLWDGLKNEIPGVKLNGSLSNRLPGNLNITIEDVKGSRLHSQLRSFISCSSGSACSNGETSHVLLALGKNKQEADASLRLSVGRTTTSEEVEMAIQAISKVVKKLRN